jgi:hypothetical protein
MSVLQDDPSWRAQYLTIRAAAALYDGHFDEVMPHLTEGVRIATETLGKGSPRLAYFADNWPGPCGSSTSAILR